MPPTAEARLARERGQKWCSRCKRSRRRSSFNRNRSTWDDLQTICRDCHQNDGQRRRAAKRQGDG